MMEPQALQPNTRIGYNYCHAPGCNNNAKNTYNLSFFRFPKDLRRCNIWIKNSKLGNRAGNTPEYCYQHYWLCSEHFEEHMFANVLKNRLKKIAIPTLFKPAIGDVSWPTTNFEQQLDCEEDYAVVDPIINTAGGTTPEDAVENVSTEIDPDLYEEEYLPDVPDVELIGSPPPTSTPSPAGTQTPKSFAEGTPQKLMYQNKIRNLQKRVIYLGKRVETLQQQTTSKEDSRGTFHRLLEKFLNPNMAAFTKVQADLTMRSAKGFRYSQEFKKLCLSVYWRGPKAYKELANIFYVPSTRTLHRMTEKHNFIPGIHKEIFSILKPKMEQFEDKHCVLLIDEMALKTHLFYNIGTDEIVGFVNEGQQKLFLLAQNACVFMLRGIRFNWKQPVGYHLVPNSCSASSLLVEICEYAAEVGISVTAVITDQGSNFIQLANLLNVTPERPYFMFQNKKVVFMFDPPHLLKSMRNNLLKHTFHVDGKIVSWQHIQQFYELDKKQNNRYAHKLTDSHLKPSNFQKMKVKLASQIFSSSVAAGMEVHLTYNALPPSAVGTIEFINRLDKLFDIFNSSSTKSQKMYRNPFNNTAKQKEFLLEMETYFNNLRVITSSGKDHTHIIKCLKGWNITINGLRQLWEELSNKDYKYLLTRRLNTDALENYFGSVRQQGGNSFAPTPIQFYRTFKKQFAFQFLHSGTENCAEDFATILTSIENISKTNIVSAEPVSREERAPAIDTDFYQHSIHEQNSLRYVCGYLIRKCLNVHNCNICEKFSQQHDQVDDSTLFCHLKAYEDANKQNFGKLKMPGDSFFFYVTTLEEIFFNNFQLVSPQPKCLAKFVALFNSINFEHPCPHFPIQYCIRLYARMRLFYTLKFVNRNFKDVGIQGTRKPIIWKHV